MKRLLIGLSAITLLVAPLPAKADTIPDRALAKFRAALNEGTHYLDYVFQQPHPYEFNYDDGGIPRAPHYAVLAQGPGPAHCITSIGRDVDLEGRRGGYYIDDNGNRVDLPDTYYQEELILITTYEHGPEWKGFGRASCRYETLVEITSEEFRQEIAAEATIQ